jgi:hypothetical protein
MFVVLNHHPTNGAETFDPTRTGLDHVGFTMRTGPRSNELPGLVTGLHPETSRNYGGPVTSVVVGCIHERDPAAESGTWALRGAEG